MMPCELVASIGKVISLAKFMQIGITGTITNPIRNVLSRINHLASVGKLTKVKAKKPAVPQQLKNRHNLCLWYFYIIIPATADPTKPHKMVTPPILAT